MATLGYISALFMGLSLGLMGGGGSILSVPILVYFFKVDGVVATGASLFIVGSTALIGAALNIIKKNVDLKTGLLFALPSFVGMFFSRRVILPNIPDAGTLPLGIAFTKSFLLLFSFGLVMLFAARAMISSKRPKRDTPHKFSVPGVVLKGLLVGLITGFVGAGGGFLMVPALALLLQLPIRIAIGTSLCIISANSFFGFLISYDSHATDWPLLLTITSLGIFGLVIGNRISPYVPEKNLKKGFGYFVLIVGLIILVEQGFGLTS